MTSPHDVKGFRPPVLPVFPWAGGETLTIATGTATGTLGRGTFRVHNFGGNVVWLRGDGGAAAAEAAHSIPIPAGGTEIIYCEGNATLAGTDGDKVHFMPVLLS